MKKALPFLIAAAVYVCLIPFWMQWQLQKAARDWTGEQVVEGSYILETYRRDEGETPCASFRVLFAGSGEVCYECPESWRTMDLKGIGWAERGFDVVIESADVGTVVYPVERWRCGALPEAESFGVDAVEGEVLPAELLQTSVKLREILPGDLTGYARTQSGEWLFEWARSNVWVQDDMGGYEQVLVQSRKSEEGYTFAASYDMRSPASPDVAAGEKLSWEDVDFDGKPDLLVCTGHHGNQGFVTYVCFLRREDGFVECPSYTDIWNPVADGENRRVLSSWRNWAASHSWASYAYKEGKFVLMDLLTEEPAPDYVPTKVNDENTIMQWTLNGRVVGRSDQLTPEEIEELFAAFRIQ